MGRQVPAQIGPPAAVPMAPSQYWREAHSKSLRQVGVVAVLVSVASHDGMARNSASASHEAASIAHPQAPAAVAS
jgi:hypothetical protein